MRYRYMSSRHDVLQVGVLRTQGNGIRHATNFPASDARSFPLWV
jgi:hypothetical protein